MSFLPRHDCGCTHPSIHVRLAGIETQSANLTTTRKALSTTITRYCARTSQRLSTLHNEIDHLDFTINSTLGLRVEPPSSPRPSSPVPTPHAIAAHIDGIDIRQIRRETILERWRDVDIADVQEELELNNSTFGYFLNPATLDQIDQRIARLEKTVFDAAVNAHKYDDTVRLKRPRCASLPSSLQDSFVPLRDLYH